MNRFSVGAGTVFILGRKVTVFTVSIENIASKFPWKSAQNKSMKILLGEYMYKNNLTARQVEILTGIPKSTINRIANEQISPRMDILEQIAKGLKLPFSCLYESDF